MPETQVLDGQTTETKTDDVVQDKHANLRGLSENEYIEAIDELRRENAAKRTKTKEMETRLNDIEKNAQKEKEAKLAEEGKLKELLDERNKQIDSLNPLKDENETYKSYFLAQIEQKEKGLTEVEREVIADIDDPAKKLKFIEKLLSQRGLNTDSPGGKPGKSSLPEKTLDEYLKPENMKRLHEISVTDKPLFERIMARKQKLEG